MASSSSSKNIIISTRTIINTIFIAAALWILYQVRSIVLSVFISLIVTLAFDPFVDWLQKRKVPRVLGTLMTYVLVLVLFAVLSGVGFGSLAEQVKGLLAQLRSASTALVEIPTVGPFLEQSLDSLLETLTPVAGGSVFRITLSAFSSVASVLTVLVFTAYLLIDFQNIKERFLELFSRPERLRVERIVVDIEDKLGSWLRGQLLLMLVVGAFTYLGLSLLGVSYALPLALIAGLFEVIPIIGPIISAVPGVLVGFSISPLMGIGVLALYILIQQLENNILVPQVMKRSVGFNPLATMLALMIGGKLFGFVGVLLAVPVTLTAVIVFKHLWKE